MKSTNRTVETLMMFIDNGLQSSLQLLVRILKLPILMGSAERARIHQLQCDLDRNALVLSHEAPFSLNILQDFCMEAMCISVSLLSSLLFVPDSGNRPRHAGKCRIETAKPQCKPDFKRMRRHITEYVRTANVSLTFNLPRSITATSDSTSTSSHGKFTAPIAI